MMGLLRTVSLLVAVTLVIAVVASPLPSDIPLGAHVTSDTSVSLRTLQELYGESASDSTATNSRSDRIVQATVATADAIQQAVMAKATRTSVRTAVSKGQTFARLATADSTRPSDFN